VQLKQFTEGKRPGTEIFDKLTTSALNQHLKNQMEGLTAKVFRTYNASYTLERELEKAQVEPNETVNEKLLTFNRANREVAILCNHQRATPKKFDEQMGKLDEKIKELKADKEKLAQHAKDLKSGKVVKSEVKDEEESDEQSDTGGNNASGLESVAKKDKKKKALRMPDDPDKCKAAIDRIDKKIQGLEFKKTEKDDLKTVALGTSKINYIDPRITAAWCKRMNVPIEKVFTKALREKFPWALEVPKNWKF
jgi:DNA topoisomerase-1